MCCSREVDESFHFTVQDFLSLIVWFQFLKPCSCSSLLTGQRRSDRIRSNQIQNLTLRDLGPVNFKGQLQVVGQILVLLYYCCTADQSIQVDLKEVNMRTDSAKHYFHAAVGYSLKGTGFQVMKRRISNNGKM
jgi:hypothetical protein